MKDKIVQQLKALNILTEDDSILVACSGGPDSMALLWLLKHLQIEIPYKLNVLHVDHGIRPESGDDADFLTDWCEQHAIPCQVERVDVPTLAVEQGEGLELTARNERHRLLRSVAADLDCNLIALGHHHDDQAETILHRIIRGTGISGLVGMKVLDGNLFRPLLQIHQQDLLELVESESIPFRVDGSNEDPRFTRNRLRHQTIPLLSETNAHVDRALTRLGQIAGREEEYWQREVEQCWLRLVVEREGEYFLPRQEVAALHPAMQYRLLRHAFGVIRTDLARIYEVHLDAVVALIGRERPQAEWQGPDVWVAVRYDMIWLRRKRPDHQLPEARQIFDAGEYHLADGLSLLVSSEPVSGDLIAALPMDLLNHRIEVRPFVAGDRLPLADGKHKKVKEYFAEQRLWYEDRARLPLLVVDGSVLWIPGYRIAEDVGASSTLSDKLFFSLVGWEKRSFFL